ncbi:uncharacterized protein LOC124932668 [Impatiens glandulifera]|uniref:uncharacterized protein LOC124932668 n=1 Tax=Impatiens glandulifera TaxID=253017 RepID=UPI001FB189CF|nr:uncharacterized protein LOC124932668 [Impatiens glandulifera]
MATDDKLPEIPSSLEGWKERFLLPTVFAGIAGAGVGSISRHRKVQGLAKISSTYAANFAIVTGCYCGAREFVRVNRHSDPEDLLDSAIAGFGSGAILGRLQGGQLGAVRYSIVFAIVGTSVDYATIKLKPIMKNFSESIYQNSQKDGGWFKIPEWSPIKVLDEEALAAKKVREEKLIAQRNNLNNLSKE